MTIVISTALEGDIDSWDDLKAQITEETDGRANSDQLASYIRRAEIRIRRLLSRSPVRPMEASQAITVALETIDAPADMVRPYAVELTDGVNRREVEYIEPENLTALQAQNASRADGYDGFPRYFTTQDDLLRFWPAPSTPQTGTLYYFQELQALSADNQTNWFLDDHADVYLDGALYFAYRAMPDIEKAALLKGIFDDGVAEAIESYPKPASRATLSVDVALSSRRFSRWGDATY